MSGEVILENKKHDLLLKYFEVNSNKKNTILLSLFTYIGFIALALLIMDSISPFYLTLNSEIFDSSDFHNNITNEVMLSVLPILYLIIRYFMVRRKCNKIYKQILKSEDQYYSR